MDHALPTKLALNKLKKARGRVAKTLEYGYWESLEIYKIELYTELWLAGEDVSQDSTAAELIETADKIIKEHSYA